jgi:hypothetical protein
MGSAPLATMLSLLATALRRRLRRRSLPGVARNGEAIAQV